MYTTFLLFFFQIFKVYSRQVSSSSVAGLLWSAHFFVTHIQTEKISSWNGPTFHVCCFMLARASTKTFVSRVRKQRKKSLLAEKFVSMFTRQPRYHCTDILYQTVKKTESVAGMILWFVPPLCRVFALKRILKQSRRGSCSEFCFTSFQITVFMNRTIVSHWHSLYRCTVHSIFYLFNTPTSAHIQGPPANRAILKC